MRVLVFASLSRRRHVRVADKQHPLRAHGRRLASIHFARFFVSHFFFFFRRNAAFYRIQMEGRLQ